MNATPQEADRIATTARIDGLWKEICREIEGGVIREAIGEELRCTYIIPLSKEGEDWSVGIMLASAPIPSWNIHNVLARASARFGRSDTRMPNGDDEGGD